MHFSSSRFYLLTLAGLANRGRTVRKLLHGIMQWAPVLACVCVCACSFTFPSYSSSSSVHCFTLATHLHNSSSTPATRKPWTIRFLRTRAGWNLAVWSDLLNWDVVQAQASSYLVAYPPGGELLNREVSIRCIGRRLSRSRAVDEMRQ